MTSCRKNSEGAALIAVLCLLSLLAVLALGALNAARRHAELARNSFVSIQQRELLDSAIRLRILELTAPPVRPDAHTIGRREFTLFDQAVSVDVEREDGRIDLNFADELLLTAAFAGNGISEVEARSLAARIIDWRDADDTPRQQGAERNEYRRDGREQGPKNGSFETPSEMFAVLGLSRVPAELSDAFTVYSQSSQIRQAAATPQVMRALEWAQARQLGGRTWVQTPTSGANDNETGAGDVLRLRGCVGGRDVRLCRITVLRLTGNPAQPALIFLWQ